MIILIRGRICKCAILASSARWQSALRFLKILNGHSDLPQAVFRNVAGRHAEGVHGLPCVKICDMPEIVSAKIHGGVNTAAREKHIRHAVLQGGAVFHLDIKLVQFFKEAVLTAIEQLTQIVGEVIVHGILCC